METHSLNLVAALNGASVALAWRNGLGGVRWGQGNSGRGRSRGCDRGWCAPGSRGGSRKKGKSEKHIEESGSNASEHLVSKVVVFK